MSTPLSSCGTGCNGSIVSFGSSVSALLLTDLKSDAAHAATKRRGVKCLQKIQKPIRKTHTGTDTENPHRNMKITDTENPYYSVSPETRTTFYILGRDR